MGQFRSFEDALTSGDFQKYASDKVGKNWDQIEHSEKMSLFTRFQVQEMNLTEEQIEQLTVSQFQTQDEMEKTLLDHYFPNQKFENLSIEEKQFIVVSAENLRSGNENIQDIKDYLTAHKSIDIENITDTLEIEGDSDRVIEKENPNKMPENPNTTPNDIQPDTRIRSANSDTNELMVDLVRIEALNRIGVVEDKDIYQQDTNGHKIMKDMTVKEVSDILSDKVPNLSKEKMVQYEDELAGLLLRSEYVDKIPPSVLAQQYQRLEARVSQEKNETRKSDMESQLGYYGKQMDKVIASAALGRSNGEDLYFADITNIADTHHGYKEIFELRGKHYDELLEKGTEQEKQYANNLKAAIEKVEPKIDAEYNNYLQEMNLNELSSDDDTRLVQRFEEHQKIYKTMQLNEETLQLVSNFKFLNEQGVAEPQFTDKNGNQSDTYTQGAQIIEGSKLAQQIQMAKEIVMIQSLGAKENITPEAVQVAVQEQLPKNLFALHVASEAEKGVEEKVDQFTNAKYLAEFTRNLTNPEQKYAVTPLAYECGTDGMVNYVGGYQAALADKVGKESQIVDKVTQPIAHMDKRADNRSNATSDKSKREIRIEMLKRCAKGFASAFALSGTITAVSTIVAADAATTVATAGTNKVAGLVAMGIGTTIGVGLTLHQINKWRKSRKAEGKSAGFKDFIKDRKMVMTAATTVLGCAALGAAATGNPSWAMGLGTAAMTVGTANGVISNYSDSRKMGLGKLESIGWSIAQAGANIVGMQAGIQTAHAGIDWYNKHNPDNTLFQSSQTHTETATKTIITEEFVYKDGVIEASKNTLMKLYDGNTDALNRDLNQIMQQLEAQGITNVEPPRFLQASVDAGMNTGVDKINFNGTDYVHNNGNNCVMGAGWQEAQGISAETVNNLASIKGADGTITVTPEAIQAFKTVDPLISASNQVGYGGITSDHFVDTRVGGLDNNAIARDDGVFVGQKDGDFFATNANGAFPYDVRYNETTIPYITTTETLVPQEPVHGVGMFGVMGNILNPVKKLKDRVGSLLDATKGFFKKKDIPTPVPVPPEPKPEPKHEPKPEPIPPVVVIDDDKKKEDPNIKKLMMDEYEIVYGIKAKEDGQSFINYCKRVEKERQADAPEKNMVQFLLNRRTELDAAINTGAPSHEKKEHDKMATIGRRAFSPQVCEIRQNIMQSNLTAKNYTGAITMSAFITMAPYALDRIQPNATNSHLIGKEGSRDITKHPNLSRVDEKSTFVVTDLNKLLVEKLPLEKCQINGTGRHAMEEAMYQVREDNGGQGAPKPKAKADRVNPKANPKQKNNGSWKTKERS